MKYIFGLSKILLILLIVYVLSAFFAKSNFKVERSRVIHASQKLVYSQFGILRNWENWSPWKEKDPDLQNTFEGKDATNGAKMYWQGDKEKSGSGSIEIVQADPPYSLVYKMKFMLPFDMRSMGSFVLSSENPTRTMIHWTNHGEIPFLLRPMIMFMDMEELMGQDFERGLVKMDSICSNLQDQIQLIMQQDSLKK